MNRVVIAAAWLVGTTIPLLVAAVFLFGCCVLPFHHVLHKVVPLCKVAAGILHSHHPDRDHPAATAPEKQQPVKRLVSQTTSVYRLNVRVAAVASAVLSSPARYRSLIALGAVRCDRDVGLHLAWLDIFRI